MEFYYHELDRNVLVLSADGGLNRETATQLVEQLGSLVEVGLRRIIVDCSRLDFISSYGVGVLVRLHNKLAKSGGDVKIAGVRSAVLKILTLMRLNQILEIYADVNQARLAFRAPTVAPAS
jgi:anti-sigma B factor antagonist